jgi:uncharacterized protein (TIRG00374 family)
MSVAQGARRRGWAKHAVGGAITLLCLFAFFRQINFAELLRALENFQWSYLILGMAALACDYALRICRWSMMLRATGAGTTFRNCSAPFLGSIALNNVLPLRLGDVVRAFVFPSSMGITKTTATSSLIIERLIDLVSLLVCLGIGLFAIRTISIPPALKSTALTLAVAGGASLCLVFLFSGALSRFFSGLAAKAARSGSGKASKGYQVLGGLLHGFNAMSRPKVLLAMLVISLFVWIGESGLFYFVLLGAGMGGSPVVALFVMAVATLSTLVPSSPGYVGSFHLAVFTAISLVGGSLAQAGSYAVIVHLALWLPTTLAGAVAIWAKPHLFRAAKSQAA